MQKLERRDTRKIAVVDFNNFKNLLSGRAFIERCIKRYGSASDFSPSFESFMKAIQDWKETCERLKTEGKMDITLDKKIAELVAIILNKSKPAEERVSTIRQFFSMTPREKYRWRPPEPFLPFPPLASYMVSLFSKIAFDESENEQIREKAIAAICKINYRWRTAIEL